MEQSMDSWFPGYSWSILVCSRCGGRHLGWKFSPTASALAGVPFYALIVEATKEELKSSLMVTLRAVGQPLAAIGLAASMIDQ